MVKKSSWLVLVVMSLCLTGLLGCFEPPPPPIQTEDGVVNNEPNNTPNNAPNNGVCGEGCGEGEVCEEGQCVCDPEQHQEDTTNCACTGPCDRLNDDVCAAGVCTCLPEERQSDGLNCGCEGPCVGGEVCVEGGCVAAAEAPLEECEGEVCVATAALVPAGPFIMGSDTGEPDERPRREVTLTRSYLIQRTEVTQGQYEDLMGNNPSGFQNCGLDCPVEDVNWFDAVAYCNALSMHEGFEPCHDENGNVIGGETVYECEGWRLPTEAEWEKAARGTDGRRYPWGEEAATCERAVMRDNNNGGYGCGREGPRPVGSKPLGVSPYGVHDMGGNVWEWTWDWYENSAGSSIDPVGPMSGSARVMRGGSWYFIAGNLRAAYRRGDISPNDAYGGVGFRCVRSN